MGKAARIGCIFTPLLLTIASFACLGAVVIGGLSHSTRNGLWFFEANFARLNFERADSSMSSLTNALRSAKDAGHLAPEYTVYFDSYCLPNLRTNTVSYCSGYYPDGYFDVFSVWDLNSNSTGSSKSSSSGVSGGPTKSATKISSLEQEKDNLSNAVSNTEEQIAGKAAYLAIKSYADASQWMRTAYRISLWTGIGTVLCSILAMFSRWGSFLTWAVSLVCSCFTFAAALTSTILFSTLVGALTEAFRPYHVIFHLGTAAIGVNWLAVVLSWIATLFWLFSVCCCSGRSNPHHRSNKGGTLFFVKDGDHERHRKGNVKLFKTDAGEYVRVEQSLIHGHAREEVSLKEYAEPMAQSHPHEVDSAYEPFRHAGYANFRNS